MLTGLTKVSAQARAEIYKRSLAESSLERQAMHLGEEVGETLIAVSHLIRERTTDKANFTEEVADLMIMLEEFSVYFGVTPADIAKAVDAKLAKYARNLKPVPAPKPLAPTTVFGKAPGPDAGCWHRYAQEPVGPKGCVCDNEPHRPAVDCEIAKADGYIETRTDCQWFGYLQQVITSTKADPRLRVQHKVQPVDPALPQPGGLYEDIDLPAPGHI